MYDRILVAVDGSVAESVVRQSALPVLLVRGAPGHRMRPPRRMRPVRLRPESRRPLLSIPTGR